MGWLSGWDYRKKKDILGSATGDQTDYQMIGLTLHYGSGTDGNNDVYLNSHCNNNFSDIRFTKDDEVTKLDYWIEDKIDGNYADIVVKVASIPSAGTYIYIYYGNAGASSESSFYDLFIFGELWEQAILDTGRWPSVTGNPIYSINTVNHYLEVTNIDGGWGTGNGFHSKIFTFPGAYLIEAAKGDGFSLYINSTNPQLTYVLLCNHHGAWSPADWGVAVTMLHDAWAGTTHGRFAGVGGNLDYQSGAGQGQIATIKWTIRKSGNIVVKEGAITRVDEANSEIPDRIHLGVSKHPSYGFGTVRIYAFRIRKYVDPEPTWSTTGSEEELAKPVPSAVLPTFKRISPETSYALKFFIEDDNCNWVDFSDRCEVGGKNTLLKVGSISYSFERGVGAFFMKTSNVELDNNDGLFDKPLPKGLVATRDSSWQVIELAASFGDTAGGLESCLYYHKAAVLIESAIRDTFLYFGRRPTLGLIPLVTCYVTGISSNWSKGTVKVELGSLAKPLQDKDAGKVKKGLSWYQNRPVKFLVEELLKEQFIQSNGEIPNSFDLDEVMEIPVTGGEHRVSAYGRPPEKMNTGEWLDEGYICRAMATRIVINTALSHDVCVDEEDFTVDDASDISKGDYLTIGPNITGKTEKVQVESISGSTLYLYRPTKYSYELGNSVKRSLLYLGCDERLYEYDPDKEEYKHLATFPEQNQYIRRLWYNENDGKLWGIIWSDVGDPGPRCGYLYVPLRVLSYDFLTGVLFSSSGGALGYAFPGDFCYRIGKKYLADGGKYDRRIGQFSAGQDSGENIPVLFDEFFDVPEFKADWEWIRYYGRNSLFDDQHHGAPDYGEIWGEASEAGKLYKYYSVQAHHGPWMIKWGMHYRFTFGQQGAVVFDSTYGTKGGIFYFIWEKNTGDPEQIGDFSLIGYDIATNTFSKFTNWTKYQIGGHPVQPTAACIDKDGGWIYVGLVDWVESVIEHSKTYLVRFKLDDSGAPEILYNSSSYLSYYFIMELLHTKDTLLHAVLLDRNRVGENDAFAIAYHSDHLGITDFMQVNSSPRRLKGLVKASIEAGEDDHLYMLEQGSARLRRYDITNNANNFFDGGVDSFPIVPEETNLAAGLVIDEVRDLLWMISAPGYPKEMYLDPPQGKYYLAKYDDHLAGRVELAEFEGMNIWEALSKLAEVVNCIMGFYPDGNFFFKERPERGLVAYQFTTVGEGNITDLSKDRNYKEVYNYSRRVPYSAKVLDPGVTVIALPNSEFNKKFKNKSGQEMETTEFFVSQADTLRKSIDLVCIKGGLISKEEVEFRFQPILGRAEFRVVEAGIGCDWIRLNDLEDIRLLDELEISDEKNGVNKETVTAGKNMTTVSADTAEDDLKLYVADTSGFVQGDRILVADDAVDWTAKEYMLVTGWTGSYLTVERSQLGTVAVIHHTGDIVYRLSSVQNKLWLSSVLVSGYNTNDLVTVRKYGESKWLTESSQIFKPGNDKWVEIGSGLYRTFVSLRFKAPTVVTLETKFMEGDKIEVVCPGMKLEGMTQSVQVSLNLSSDVKYGRRPYPVKENRFLNYRLCENAVGRDLELFADPRYLVSLTGEFLPRLHPLDTVVIVEPKTFAKATVENYLGISGYIAPALFHAVKGYIRSLTHDPVSGKTKVEIRVYKKF